MKQIKFVLVFVIIANATFAQKMYVAPFSGINFSSFGYAQGGREANSILTYPYFNQLNPGLGIDVVYSKNKARHVLSIASTPIGISFNGRVDGRGINNGNNGIIFFRQSSSDKQLNLGYQVFHEQDLRKSISKRKVSIFYGIGASVGFNRSNEFYRINNIPITGGIASLPDSIYYAYEYTKVKIQSGIFILPEVGFTYYSKKEKPIVNLSVYYYIGLRPQVAYNLTLQYGKINSATYFEEEKPILAIRGGLFGAKLSFPILIYSKKSAKVKK